MPWIAADRCGEGLRACRRVLPGSSGSFGDIESSGEPSSEMEG